MMIRTSVHSLQITSTAETKRIVPNFGDVSILFALRESNMS